eukprot:jgi/Tetstr1/440293/TSEL_003055.t1
MCSFSINHALTSRQLGHRSSQPSQFCVQRLERRPNDRFFSIWHDRIRSRVVENLDPKRWKVTLDDLKSLYAILDNMRKIYPDLPARNVCNLDETNITPVATAEAKLMLRDNKKSMKVEIKAAKQAARDATRSLIKKTSEVAAAANASLREALNAALHTKACVEKAEEQLRRLHAVSLGMQVEEEE